MQGMSKLLTLLMAGAAVIYAMPARAEEAAAPPGAGSQVQEVIVTANKRKESLQSVPVAVAAITAQKMAAIGVTDITTLQTTVPGLQFPKLFSGSSPALRGIGSSFGIGGEENEVALYIDDVYIASASVASSLNFNNVSQIQVFYGPQGTLFGRNAMAGVINIDTQDPSSKPKADLSVGYGNYNTASTSFYGNLPINDAIMANLAITADDQQDGWGRNLYTHSPAFTQKDFSARTKWLFKPDDLTTITLIADYSRSHYDDGIAMRPVQGALFPNGQVFQGFYNVDENVNSFVDTRQGGLSAKIDRDLGFAHLISITAWRKSTAYNNADEDQTILPSQYMTIPDKVQTESEELRLVSKDAGNLTWLAGFFYFHDVASLPLGIVGTALSSGAGAVGQLKESFVQTIDSYAAFGQATYALPYGFHLTGGLRYTYDNLAKNGTELVQQILPTPPITFVSLSDSGQTSESAWTYKVNLEKDLAPNVTAYIGYSTGFKGGIYNDADLTAPAVKPETLDDLEGGIKSELFDHRLRLNMAVYHYDYNNLQVTSLTRASTGQTSSELENAASAKNTGFELSFDAMPTNGLTLSGGIEIMHSRFTSFPDATISTPLPGGGNTTVSGSATGLMVPHSPDYSGNLSAEYRISTGYGDFITALNGSYESPFAWDADNRLKQHAYGLLNGSIQWLPIDEHWEVKLWAKNITNTKYSIYTTANVVGDEESPAPPLTFGLTVTHHFL
jgi:iron complex outermembrane receptor protein